MAASRPWAGCPSSLAWSTAAASVVLLSPQQAVWVLFFGGMFIFPVGVVIGKILGGRATHAKGNPLASLAAGADGVVIEVHPDPDRATSDGAQSLSPANFAALIPRLSAVAQAVGRSLAAPVGIAT